ncbi:unnamed protein product [Bemisia tabaci]|uniref:tRNA-binding domain-containing protein n=1 Tax=Bemisia tabaci TaxID=7038 RepID=A0A9P0A7M3_BEMTA|nr:unnamed protein product [Bemisia tabaci]
MLTLQNIICLFSMLILGLHSLNVDERMLAPGHYDVAGVKLLHSIRGGSNESIATESYQPMTKQKRKVQKPIDFSRLEFKVGKIRAIREIRFALDFYIAEIDVGEYYTRTVISGLVNYYPIQELEKRRVIVLCNIGPRDILGYAAQGILLCAGDEKRIEVLEPPYASRLGDKVTVAGYNGTADRFIKKKFKIFEKVSEDLRVNEEKIACYKGIPLQVRDTGFVKTATLRNVSIISKEN